MSFTYQAFDRAGKRIDGAIECATEAEAREKLAGQGLYVSSIRAGAKPRKPAAARTHRHKGGAKRLKHLSMFTRQLAVLVSTGTPVVDALRTLETQSNDGTWRGVVADVRLRVEEGATLSEALAAHPEDFSPVARSLVQAGESGGNLQEMLHRLANLTRQQERIRSSITGAMVYPALLLCVSSVVLVLMIVFVLPKFAGLFETLDAPLPPTTKMLMALSDFLRTRWYVALAAAGGLIAAIVFWFKSDAGKRWLDSFSIGVPIFGKVVRALAVARFARLLGVLLTARVPLNESLALVRCATPNAKYHALIESAEHAVIEGEPLSGVLAKSPLLPDSLAEAVRNGEKSGSVGYVLNTIADFMDEDNEVVIRAISSLIEPVILVGLGGLVAFVALSLFLPLFDLTAMMGA